MNSIYQLNERIKEQILKPENCHCTYRVINGPTTATAHCSEDKKVKANLVWHHTASKTRIILRVPFGVKYSDIILHTDELESIDDAILGLFIKMDTAWGDTNTEDDVSST